MNGDKEIRGVQVFQHDLFLEPEHETEARNRCWRVHSLEGEVVVRFSNGQEAQRIALDNGWFIFKLSDDDWGRCVKSVSSGWYLVIVPQEWVAEDTQPPITPEMTVIEGYKAHFFLFDDEDRRSIAFRTPTGELKARQRKGARFQLVGNHLADGTQYRGPVFGPEPPMIGAVDEADWHQVSVVVVGEEGRGQGQWRAQYLPNDLQRLYQAVAKKQCGWFFVRFYGLDGTLMESTSFQFAFGVRRIDIPGCPALPPQGGYQPVSVDIEHEPSWGIEPAEPDKHSAAQIIRSSHTHTQLLIPSTRDADETQWRVVAQGHHHVVFQIRLGRTWWAATEEGQDGTPIGQWSHRPLDLAPQDFCETSRKILHLLLPNYPPRGSVQIDFDASNAGSYRVSREDLVACVPLREFCDRYQGLSGGTAPVHLNVWLDDGMAVVATVRKKRPPPLTLHGDLILPPPPFSVEGFVRREILARGLVRKLQEGLSALRSSAPRRCKVELDAWCQELNGQAPKPQVVWTALCAVDILLRPPKFSRPPWLDRLWVPEVARKELQVAELSVRSWWSGQNNV